MLFKVGETCIFRDGVTIECSGRLPAPPPELEGVREIRVLPDGTIERYSDVDWAWKPAPELQGYVDGLHKTFSTVKAELDAVIATRANATARISPMGISKI